MAGAGPAVRARDLSVRRGGVQALKDVSCDIGAGLVTGLFGPSGSGKSTLIRAIAGVQANVRGELSVLGGEAGSPEARAQLGYMTQAPSVYEDLTVEENLGYFAAVRGAAIGPMLERTGLTGQAGRLVRDLSGGQRARVSLAAALLGTPALLLLDEPTVGLDPLLRRELWRLFRGLVDDGATLVISSHVLDEARHCDRLLLLRDGALLADLAPQELIDRTGTSDLDEAFVRLIEAG